MRFKYYLRGAGIGVIAATLILSIAFLFQNNISDEEVMRRATKLGMVMEDSSSGTLADMQQPGTSAVDLENRPDNTDSGNEGTNDPDGSGDGSGSQGSQDNSRNPDEDPLGDQSDNPDSSDTTQKDDTDPDQNTSKEPDTDSDIDKDTDQNDNSGSRPDNSSDKNTGNKDSDKNTDKNADKNTDKDTDKNKDKDSDSKPSGGSQTSNKAIITIESGDVSRIVSAKVFEAGLVDSADEFNSYLGEHGYANLLQPGTYEITKGATFRQIAVILTTRR